MRVLSKVTYILSTTAFLTCAGAYGVSANEELLKLTSDPKNWAMQSGDYANTRYSKLNQINKDNVKNLQVKWTFSTGVLRGHEGGPLVIGDVMYVHTPFPNIVYALDLNNDGKVNQRDSSRYRRVSLELSWADKTWRSEDVGSGRV